MKTIADTHTHTLASDHAYSTLSENILEASKKQLKFLCMTEHASTIPGAPSDLHFWNLKSIPRYIDDVMLIRGAEVNIISYDGGLDLSDELLDKLEWNIASFHPPCLRPSDARDHTRAWRIIAENPKIDVIGHCGDGRFESDYREIVKAFAEHGKIVEINNHSFTARPGSDTNCIKVASLCAEYNVPVVISSDAHFYNAIGVHDKAIAMLEKIDFPENLVLNIDEKRFLDRLHQINGGALKDE